MSQRSGGSWTRLMGDADHHTPGCCPAAFMPDPASARLRARPPLRPTRSEGGEEVGRARGIERHHDAVEGAQVGWTLNQWRVSLFDSTAPTVDSERPNWLLPRTACSTEASAEMADRRVAEIRGVPTGLVGESAVARPVRPKSRLPQ
jgi:hypothetical protein